MARKPAVAIVGSGDSQYKQAISDAAELGGLIGSKGWILITGGRNAGVMAAATNAAHKAGGFTIGILPKQYREDELPDGLDVSIVTDMGNARNNVIGLSASVVVACGIDGPGTASEVALALKNKKAVILLNATDDAGRFFESIRGSTPVFCVRSASEAFQAIKKHLGLGGD